MFPTNKLDHATAIFPHTNILFKKGFLFLIEGPFLHQVNLILLFSELGYLEHRFVLLLVVLHCLGAVYLYEFALILQCQTLACEDFT